MSVDIMLQPFQSKKKNMKDIRCTVCGLPIMITETKQNT